ncbi:MAG: cysteine desulfurase [Nitrososphaerota archaeon]|nr:cysteine desulfurase [Nitrososphaerota archaeon]
MRVPVYLDHHATTPMDPRVMIAVAACMRDDFGNASSIDHQYGMRAAELVEIAREKVASTLRAKAEEIVFTSGATESDNLAILGVSEVNPKEGDHYVTTAIEHKAVLDSFRTLENRGKKVTYLPVTRDGLVSPDALTAAIRSDTRMVSIMLANNEIGTIQEMASLSKIVHDAGALLHVDAAQAVGHIPVDVGKLDLDLVSFSAHKVYGPKGVGGLYVGRRNRRVELRPQLLGGGQEHGLRSGTLNVPGIVGIGEALAIASKEMARETRRIGRLRDRLQSGLLALGDVSVNGHTEYRLPHNLNVRIGGVDGKALISSTSKSVAFSASSACSAQSVEPSHVLIAIGHTPESAHMCVRFGLGRWTTDEETDFACEVLAKSIHRLRLIRTAK